MKIFDLKKMTKGWFVGDFEPVVIRTSDCEVAVKSYSKGDKESRHFHKLADEITLVVNGKIRLNNNIFSPNDIILIEKYETVEFEALEDSITVVYKSGSFKNDKFITDEE